MCLADKENMPIFAVNLQSLNQNVAWVSHILGTQNHITMKNNRFFWVCLLMAAFLFTNASPIMAGKKADMRVAYVLKNMGISRDLQGKLKPLLVSYLADKKAAEKQYEDMKDKLKGSIDNGTLTEKQAQALLNAKWTAAEKELAVKRQYETKFKTVLSAKKTYLCFDLLNDKKSKVMGTDKNNKDED